MCSGLTRPSAADRVAMPSRVGHVCCLSSQTATECIRRTATAIVCLSRAAATRCSHSRPLRLTGSAILPRSSTAQQSTARHEACRLSLTRVSSSAPPRPHTVHHTCAFTAQQMCCAAMRAVKSIVLRCTSPLPCLRLTAAAAAGRVVRAGADELRGGTRQVQSPPPQFERRRRRYLRTGL